MQGEKKNSGRLPRSPLCGLDHILELVERLCSGVGSQGVGKGEHVVGDRGANNVRERVVDIHDLGLGHRGNHAAQGCIDGLVVGRGSDACGIDAADGLVVSLRSRLQEVPVHGAAHDNGLVHCLEGLVRRDARQGLQVDGRQPVNALEERVRLLGQLRCGCADLVGRRRGGRRCCRGHLVGLHHILELQERRVGLLGIGRVHLRLHVGRNGRVRDLRHGVIDVHDRLLGHRGHDAADRRVRGLPVRLGGHAVGPLDGADGLVVRISSGLEQLGVRLCAHDNHLVDGIQGLDRLELARGLQEDAILPVDLGRKRVGGVSELLGRVADLVRKGRCGSERGHGPRRHCRDLAPSGA
mmetsp:Transcript_58679/g.184020  ORF Transcript_58679/g.184020 Transcript_58679/m.184020 type:complete len:353 (-) Transcript_58679:149-1207(-)